MQQPIEGFGILMTYGESYDKPIGNINAKVYPGECNTWISNDGNWMIEKKKDEYELFPLGQGNAWNKFFSIYSSVTGTVDHILKVIKELNGKF